MGGRLTTYVITDRGGGEHRPEGPHAERLLVLLHGYGATEHDLTALGPLLDPDRRFLVAGVRGPVAVDDAGAAWFTSGPLGPEAASFGDALRALRATVDELCAEHLLAPDEVVVGGFSQGAAMALALGLAADERPPPAGILCLSGFLVDVEGVAYDWERAAGVPVLVQHGSRDAVVPVELGADTAAALHHHGVAVTWHEYPMGHQTTIESLTDARSWLARVAAGERPSAPPP